MIMNSKLMRGRAYDYVNKLIPGYSEFLRGAIFAGAPIHFYGDGIGKSTLCQALRNLGVKNVSESGELGNIEGCWGIPDEFSGALIIFRNKELPVGAPAVNELPDLLRFWI